MIKPDELELVLEALKHQGRLVHIDLDLTKSQYSILRKWDRRGHWDFGVSLRTGWMTPEGVKYFIELASKYVLPETAKSGSQSD